MGSGPQQCDCHVAEQADYHSPMAEMRDLTVFPKTVVLDMEPAIFDGLMAAHQVWYWLKSTSEVRCPGECTLKGSGG